MKTGQRRYFTGFIRDLTERQKTEARLQELQSELVHVSRLTAMGEMASALAHELNQPLSAIANYMKGSRRLLEDSTDERVDDPARRHGQGGRAGACAPGQIIRRLRDFVARGESERRVERRQEARRGGERAGAGRRQGPRACACASSSIRASISCLADKVQIQQVLLNLMRNAIEAMEDSERRELVISTASAPDDMIEITVADTGAGISPEITAQLFQPFVTTKRQRHGRRPVDLAHHRGGAWRHDRAAANPGGGTVFSFTLPAVTKEEVGDAV